MDWLKSAATAFEKANFGIYFDMETLTREQLESRLLSGEAPDIISFNSGDIDKPELYLMELAADKKLPDSLLKSGTYNGVLLAVPLFRSGHAIVINDDVLYEQGSSPPANFEDINMEWLSQLPSSFIAYDGEDSASRIAVISSDVEAGAKAAIGFGTARTYEDFFNGNIAVIAASTSTLYGIKQAGAKSYAPSHTVFPVTGFSGRAQYAGVCKTQDKDKMDACAAYLSYLLKENQQAKLANIYALPVINVGKLPNDSQLAALWTAESDTQPLTPNAFEYNKFMQDYINMEQRVQKDANGAESLGQWVLSYCN
jgi:ABC-type glycerol-3-phosphate transport system substrate-binding protein